MESTELSVSRTERECMTAAQEAFDEAMGGIQLKKRMPVQKEALGSGDTSHQ